MKNRTYSELGNDQHASLCQTAFHKNLLTLFKDIVSEEKTRYFDIALWRSNVSKHIKEYSHHCVGMKALPGRMGIGGEHRSSFKHKDPELKQLKFWIGEMDAIAYEGIMKNETKAT